MTRTLCFLLLLLPALSGNVFAQSGHQSYLDTSVVTDGVLAGYPIASGGEVLRMQYGPMLELHRYDADGLPMWWRGYSIAGATWEFGAVASDGDEGARMLSAPRSVTTGQQRVEFEVLSVDGSGTPQWSFGAAIDVSAVQGADMIPRLRLVRGIEGSCFVLLDSSDPGYGLLRIMKFSALGEVLWVHGVDENEPGAGPAWGSAGTLACSDGVGGLFLARHEPGAASLWVAHMDATGALLWTRSLDDPDGYTVDVFDMAVDAAGNVRVLGRMNGQSLPSGGLLLRLSGAGALLRADRYQWDIGRKLFILEDGSMAAVKIPWIYRMDTTGTVVRSASFQEWVIEPHLHVFSMTNMDVDHGRLWMQGALRRILIQFGTQRLWPAFASHPVDSIAGCQWESDLGFATTPLDTALFGTASWLPITALDLAGTFGAESVPVVLSDVDRHDPLPLCNFTVGLAEDAVAATPAMVLATTLVQRGTDLEFLELMPGTVEVRDVLGRLIMRQVVRSHQGRYGLSLPPEALGTMVVRWVATDGSSSSSAKFIVL
jgi:hypothetical protein